MMRSAHEGSRGSSDSVAPSNEADDEHDNQDCVEAGEQGIGNKRGGP